MTTGPDDITPETFEAELVSADDSEGITPKTRRLIIASLAVVALTAIVAEVLIILLGETSSDALLTVAATAVGALGGIALPGRD